MKRISLLAVLALVWFVGSAGQAEARAYVGASYLASEAESIDSESLDSDSYKIFGGFNFFKFFGVEASYRDLGSFSSDSTDFSSDLEGFDLSARGIIPIGKFRIWGRVGYSYLSEDGSFEEISFDDSTWELVYGAGVSYLFINHLELRGEWEKYDVDRGLDSWSLGLAWVF